MKTITYLSDTGCLEIQGASLVTKYRRQIFDHDATEKLRTYFSNVCADFEAERVEMDGGPDHVHLLINYPPKLAISSLVNSLKG
ncbi:IS200/IS605 family transposase, partial [Escherichia coli]